MMRYVKATCRCCDKNDLSAGFQQVRHQRKHRSARVIGVCWYILWRWRRSHGMPATSRLLLTITFSCHAHPSL